MTASLLLDNLFAWSMQVAVLVSLGALAAMTLAHPMARLIFWQGILAITLLLPALEPWQQPMAEDVGTIAAAQSAAPVIVVHRPAFRFSWRREYILALLAAGAALRFLWIGAGLVRLRRHRLDARMLTIPPVRFSNPRVRWFVSSTVGGPVTFGFLNPSILLPSRVAELPDDLREAIAHHELAHVRRRDWLFVLAEEAIRSLLWFHPAIWFVLSRIQLAREQVVDAEVVGLTRDRERYLDALVAVAAQRLLPDVAPAPLFLKKRQLEVRVAAVLKEKRMSKTHTFLSYTTVCSAAIIAVRLAVWMFPMQAPAQSPNSSRAASIVADGPGVVVEPGAKVLHRSPVFYPSGVSTAGTVIVESTVNAKGEVTDARVVSGPEELRNAALSSVLNWHFSPDGGLPPTVQSVVRFTAPPQTAQATSVTATAPAVYTGQTLRIISIIGLSDELAEKVRGNIPVHVGDAFGNDQLARVREAVKEIDQHLITGIRRDSSGTTLTIMLAPEGMSRGVTGGIIGGIVGGIPGPRPEVIRDLAGVVTDGSQSDLTPAERQARLQQLAHDIVTSGSAQASTASFPPSADGTQRIRVGGNVQAYNLIKKVTPMYPPLAKQARIQGTVRFTALIGMDGSIASLQLVEGHPLLVESAREAVAQWMYKPTLLNGNPVEVITQIDVNYTLTQ